jgi:hypothetical protein
MNETRRNYTEPGFSSPFVERAHRNVTRKIAAQGSEFVVNPKRKFRPVAPKGKRAKNKNDVTDNRQKTKRWTRTPRKH